ncbi:hypothetical protein FB451DRAFT_1228973 [Mycena latifolia]|nr:hypothetical protein FB451DRAFT_1228973 [Mycena latifolia]
MTPHPITISLIFAASSPKGRAHVALLDERIAGLKAELERIISERNKLDENVRQSAVVSPLRGGMPEELLSNISVRHQRRYSHGACSYGRSEGVLLTKCIVDRASATSAAGNEEALEALKLVLEDIHSYLTFLGKPRPRLTPWVFANQEKNRFTELNSALDKALTMFSATHIIGTAVGARSTTGQIAVLVSSVQRLDNDIIHADLHKLSEAALGSCEGQSSPGCGRAEDGITACLPFLASSQLTFLFDI